MVPSENSKLFWTGQSNETLPLFVALCKGDPIRNRRDFWFRPWLKSPFKHLRMAFFLQGNLQKTQLSVWTSLNQVLMNACFSYFSEQALPGLGDWWQFQSAANNRICFIICSLHLFKRKTLACKNEYAWLNLHSYRDTAACHSLCSLLQGLLVLSLQWSPMWHPSLKSQACWCFSLITAITWPGIIRRNPE